MKNGVDIAKIDRFEKLSQNQSFLDKYLSNEEKNYLQQKENKAQTLAGIYSAKEAVLKALGLGIGNGLNLADISISHNDKGAPFVLIDAKINYYLMQNGCSEIAVSISHDGDYAIAFCVIL